MRNEIVARELMTQPVKTVSTLTTVREAAEIFLRNGISGAPVVDESNRPVGVFSLSDLARHVHSGLVDLPEIDPARERTKETGEWIPTGKGFHFEGMEITRVTDLMTPGIVAVDPETGLEEIIHRMSARRIHRVFVLNKMGGVAGVITSMDVLQWTERMLRTSRVAHTVQPT